MTTIQQFEPLFGEWYAESLIGTGSFGRVYKIKREDFDATYYSALKYISLPQSEAESSQLRQMGMNDASISEYYGQMARDLSAEIQLMYKLRGNTNIVAYEDHKRLPKPNGMGYDIFIRMELLTPLDRYAANRSLSEQEIIRLGSDICNALELCGRHHIIHRDIKPENIFVSQNGDFKLGDFGIARQLERTGTNLTKIGTKNYMAPEIIAGSHYDATVDIYALGIVMYRLLNNNRIPFVPQGQVMPSDWDQALIRRSRGDSLSLPVNAQNRLGEIVLKACASGPRDRYQTPPEMREALDMLRSGRDVLAEIPPFVVNPPIKEPPPPAPAPTPQEPPKEEEGTQSPEPVLSPPMRSTDETVSLFGKAATSPAEELRDTPPSPVPTPPKPRKKMLVLLAAAFFAVLLTSVILILALSNKGGSGTDVIGSGLHSESGKATATAKATTTAEATAAPTPTPVPIVPLATFEMSDELFGFTVMLDGDVFQLPVTLEVFQSYGWKAEKELSGAFIPGQYGIFYFTRNGNQIYVQLANMSEEVRFVQESTVIFFGCDLSNNKAELELPKGIKCGVSTKEDILAAYGEPYSIYEPDDDPGYCSLTYKYANSSYREINIRIKDYVVFEIHVENAIRIDSDVVEVSTEITDKEKSYRAPAELGDDIKSFNVMIDGDLYHLPAPLSAFLDNGWAIYNKTLDHLPGMSSNYSDFSTLSSGGHSGFTLKKGDKYIEDITFYNYSLKPLAIEYCFIIEIDSKHLVKVEMELPGGIKIGTPESDFLSLFSRVFEKDTEETYGRRYTFFAGKNRIVGSRENKDNEIVIDVGKEGVGNADAYIGKIYAIRLMNVD
ncbi:MAG: serine/threonine protein kinase [Clostridiales bacterium]|nr:serine/threonine protein kinase [Clostridiales bacterium]